MKFLIHRLSVLNNRLSVVLEVISTVFATKNFVDFIFLASFFY
jgi:hypothetical protein